MRAHRQKIATDVAQRLFAAEAALDIAAARIAELNAALPLARLDANLAASVGQEALARSASAIVLVAQTRAEIIATHASLKEASSVIGLGEMAFGDLIKEDTLRSPGGQLRAA
ncbi:hypothetical protein [Novosphingobium sp. BL-52-GroH]|uniref:hypothetical protein n=1 Tax=Novosphingobium sp. BL-52-GroH TaxID=3349877 RepID=UPI003850FF7E